MTYDFDTSRKIIHVDMDAFFASVEQLDNPDLKGKAIAVGGSSDRGVISAASYEARKYGVRSAMSSVKAKEICPHLIFVKHHFNRYKEVSQQIRKIFFEYTDLVEPLSLDEAYLDVTKNKKGNPSASLIAQEIRSKIVQQTGLTASAGISINKFIAKVASDYNKPNGQKTIPPNEVIDFLERLDIKKFYGVGKVTQKKMYALGIYSGSDLKLKTEDFLIEKFGKAGKQYYNIVRGVHQSNVKPQRTRKSIGAERTFSQNLASEIYMEDRILELAEELGRRCKKNKIAGKTVTLKIKYSDFNVHTRSKTLSLYISNADLIFENAKELLYQQKTKNSVRLLGLSLSSLNNTTPTPKKNIESKKMNVQLEFKF